MKYADSAKRAIATFIFASTGVLVGGVLDSIPVWKTALWAGVGAILNFLYRAAETFLNDLPEGE